MADLKDKAKYAAAVSAIMASSLFTEKTQAAEAPVKENKIEFFAHSDNIAKMQAPKTYDSRKDFDKTEDNLPKYIFSNEQVGRMVLAADLSEEQCTAFLKAYVDNLDEIGAIDATGLVDAMEKANFSKEQAQKFSEALTEEFSRAAAEQEQAPAKDKPKVGEKHHIETENGNIDYWLRGTDLCYKGHVSVRTDNLMPKMYATKDGTYKCGPRAGANKRILHELVNENIRAIATNEIIAKDMRNREANGETLEKSETNFLKIHAMRMEKYGLFVDKKGNLQQKNPEKPLANFNLKQAQR